MGGDKGLGTRGYEVGTRGDVGWGRIGTWGWGATGLGGPRGSGAEGKWGYGAAGRGRVGLGGCGAGTHGDAGRGHTGTQGRAVPPHSFNQLDLPAYESYEKLRQMLLLAIQECSEGFGLA